MGKIQSTRNTKRKPEIRWFGFGLSEDSAKILFFIALLGFLGAMFWLLLLTMGLMQVLAYSSSLQATTGYEFGAMYYGSAVMGQYIIQFVFLVIVLAILIYTLIATSKFRKYT